jgi:hypothetical protein
MVLRTLECQETMNGLESHGVRGDDPKGRPIGEVRLCVGNHTVPASHVSHARHRLHVNEHWHREVAIRKCALHVAKVRANPGNARRIIDLSYENDSPTVRQRLKAVAGCRLLDTHRLFAPRLHGPESRIGRLLGCGGHGDG